MPNDANTADLDQASPKKKGLDLSDLLKHVAEVDTPVGMLYLFPWRVSDLSAFSEKNSHDTIAQIREFIPHIASFSNAYGLQHDRVGIPPDKVSQLSDKSIEAIAEAYTYALHAQREDGNRNAPLAKEFDEPATRYLARFFRGEIEAEAKRTKEWKDQILGSATGMFDEVRRASHALGNTRQQFEHLINSRVLTTDGHLSSETRSQDFVNHAFEHSLRLESERSEDRSMARLTGKMTAQSAETLQLLAAAASTMLEQLNRRDVESKHTTKVQLWLAVGSVALSAILALVALVVSIVAYKQDKENISSGDKWQASVLEELRVTNQRSSQSEAKNRDLAHTVEQLRTRISELESRSATPPLEPKLSHR